MGDKKIGTYNGISFYTSLGAIIKDGKQLRNLENQDGTLPHLITSRVGDSTGKKHNLKEVIGREYENLLEALTIKLQENSAIITYEKDYVINNSSIIAIYEKESVAKPFFAIEEGYRLAHANISIPYTIQSIR